MHKVTWRVSKEKKGQRTKSWGPPWLGSQERSEKPAKKFQKEGLGRKKKMKTKVV